MDYLEKQAKADGYGGVADSLYNIRGEALKLFVMILANRGCADNALRKDGVAAPKLLERFSEDFVAKGTTDLEPGDFDEALCGIFSRQVDDKKIAKGLIKDVKDALIDDKRSTAIDWKMVSKAAAATARIAHKQAMAFVNRFDTL